MKTQPIPEGARLASEERARREAEERQRRLAAARTCPDCGLFEDFCLCDLEFDD